VLVFFGVEVRIKFVRRVVVVQSNVFEFLVSVVCVFAFRRVLCCVTVDLGF